jgi:hypothetical protein
MGAFYLYYFGFRQICLVELTPTELRWRYALRGGAAPLSDVRSIRCSQVSRRGSTVDVATVECRRLSNHPYSRGTPLSAIAGDT